MAVDTFIKINGIDGEAEDHGHAKEIQVLAWSWGVSQAGTMAHGGGGGAGKANFQDLNFTHYVDKASTKLFLACATGKHIPDATLIVRKAGEKQQEYLMTKLYDLLVTNVSTSASSEMPIEQVTLNFKKIEVGYKPQKADGSLDAEIKVGYDLKLNKAA